MSEYIVIQCQIVGNPEIGYSSAYYCDMVRKPSVKQAIKHGLTELGHDDFLIGKVDGRRLVSLQWMEEVRDYSDESDSDGNRHEREDCANQLCLEVAP